MSAVMSSTLHPPVSSDSFDSSVSTIPTIPPAPTDWNDLGQLVDLAEVRRQVEQASPTLPASSALAMPAAEWPEPILPGTARTPAIPAELLPGWLGDHARAVSDATQTPPALAVMASLSILAAVLQGRFEVEVHPGYVEPLALWTLGTAPPGARKTAVLNAVLAPLVRWEKLQRDRSRSEIAKVSATRAVGKKRIERLLHDAAKAKDATARELIRAEVEAEELALPDEIFAPRLFSSDCTAERLQNLMVEQAGRMAVLSDEAGIFLIMSGIYSGGQANNDVFLQGHAGSAMRVDRAGRLAHIDKPALSFGLLLQPATLGDVASSPKFRNSGLLARFLFAMPQSNVGTRDVRRHTPVPIDVAEEYEFRILSLLEGVGVPAPVAPPKVLSLSADAHEHWLCMAEGIEREQGDGGKYESISDWTSKLPGAVARIAALLELAQGGLQTNQVGLDCMDRAVALARVLIPHAQAAFGLLGTDAVDSDASAILKWVRAGDRLEFTRRECQKGQEGRFRNVERLKKALERLEAMDVLRELKRPNRGAPPTTCYQVNPKALST